MGQREVGHIGKCREASRIAVRGEVGRIVGRRDLIRKDQEGATEPDNLAHKMRRESQLLRQIRK
jgi:hypothetical protein